MTQPLRQTLFLLALSVTRGFRASRATRSLPSRSKRQVSPATTSSAPSRHRAGTAVATSSPSSRIGTTPDLLAPHSIMTASVLRHRPRPSPRSLPASAARHTVCVVDLVVVPTPRGLVVDQSVAGPGAPPATGSEDAERLIPVGQAAAWVRAREQSGDGHSGPRWVWPDTASAYPPLLQSDTRVERCHDLRLCHAILALASAEPWPAPPRMPPLVTATGEPPAPTLLAALTPAETPPLEEVVTEHRRQLAAVAASADPGRLRLLLAAESAGALIAAEMHRDGLPWDRDRHDAILTAELGPRPPRGMRPARLEQLAAQVR